MSTAIVDVTFLDADSGQTIMKLKLPARQLPESFATDTTLDLGQDDWQVVEARPVTATEFIAKGALTLRLRKLQKIDPREILFSLPTVADEVPKGVPAEGEVLLTLHEDDWLQLELVPAEVEAQLAADLTGVRRVLEHERKGPGFERLHIRKALPAPFGMRVLNVAALEQRFGARRAIAWLNQSGLVEHGFAFALPGGAVLYGVADGPRVAQLGVSRADADVRALREAERLLLVDWCAAKVTRW